MTDWYELESTDLRNWIVSCLAGLTPDRQGDWPPIPELRPGESMIDRLVNNFRVAQPFRGRADKMRDAIIDVLRAEGLTGRDARVQLLGSAIEVAGRCGFSESASVVAAWVRDDRYAGCTYLVGGHTRQLRRTLWAVLVAWKYTEGLTAQLDRDIGRFDQECTTICFAELGRVDRDAAIRRLPVLLAYDHQYWSIVLGDFFVAARPNTLASRATRDAWREALTIIAYDSELEPLIAKSSSPTSTTNRLTTLLVAAGYRLDATLDGTLVLSSAKARYHVRVIPRRELLRYAQASEAEANVLMHECRLLRDVFGGRGPVLV